MQAYDNVNEFRFTLHGKNHQLRLMYCYSNLIVGGFVKWFI